MIALRAKCSGLILGLQRISVIKSPSFSLEYCYETTRHQIDQIGPNVCVYGYRCDFSDHQDHQFEFLHDDLPRISQLRFAEGYLDYVMSDFREQMKLIEDLLYSKSIVS